MASPRTVLRSCSLELTFECADDIMPNVQTDAKQRPAQGTPDGGPGHRAACEGRRVLVQGAHRQYDAARRPCRTGQRLHLRREVSRLTRQAGHDELGTFR